MEEHDADADLIPQQFGDYTLLQRVGSGGLSEVWRAVVAMPDEGEHTVALKRVRASIAHLHLAGELLAREGQLAARLAHPNIARILDAGVIDGRNYIAMEYVDGHDLLAILVQATRRRRRLPAAMCGHVAVQLCRALEHAHLGPGAAVGQGLVHHDVSPANVLISNDGEVKLTDFGLALPMNAEERAGARTGERARGNVSYMAPELLDGGPLDGRADVFALGVLLYECLTLRRLFRAGTDQETTENVRTLDVAAVLQKERRLPGWALSILRRALERDVTRRYPSAATLRADLERVMSKRDPTDVRRQIRTFVGGLFAEDLSHATAAGSAAPDPHVERGPFDRSCAGRMFARFALARVRGRMMVTRNGTSLSVYFRDGVVIAGRDDVRGRAIDTAPQLTEVVVDLWTWDDGTYSWHPDEQPVDGVMCALDPLHLVAVGLRVVQEKDLLRFFRRVGNPRLTRVDRDPFDPTRLGLSAADDELLRTLKCPAVTAGHIIRQQAKAEHGTVVYLLYLMLETGFLRKAKGSADW